MSYGDKYNNGDAGWTYNQADFSFPPVTPNGGDITVEFTANTGASSWDNWVASETRSAPDMSTCVICGENGANFFCELCRQAVLLFRRKVLEDMARDLMEMA